MKLSISNIGWGNELDESMYSLIEKHRFGLEIAPTRIFPIAPYEHLENAKKWSEKLKEENKILISSIQSIWYGREEKLFGTTDEREKLVAYTKKAIDFAQIVECNNLVFGCPRNRVIFSDADKMLGVAFFKEIGEYAYAHNTVIGIEANPPLYNTNYINTTESALELIEQVNSPGVLLNLDVGTMIENGEDIKLLQDRGQFINHVHISEPGLAKIQERELHGKLALLLKQCKYQNYVSIEMGKGLELQQIENVMMYVKEIFC